MGKFELRIYESGQLKGTLVFDDPVVLGRQEQHGPPPYESCDQEGEEGLVVANHIDKGIPRRWFRLCATEDAKIRLDNLHARLSVVSESGVEVEPGKSHEFPTEVLIPLGYQRAVRAKAFKPAPTSAPTSAPASTPFAQRVPPESIGTVDREGGPDAAFRSLSSLPQTPGSKDFIGQTMTLRQFSQPNGQAIVDLLRHALRVVEKSANSDAFFQAAADAACEIVALDRAIVMIRDSSSGQRIVSDSWVPDDWHAAAERIAPGVPPESLPRISQNIIQFVVNDSLTKIHDPMQADYSPMNSLQNITCVVASPILDQRGKVIGVLYGDRWTQRDGFDHIRITDVEATLVEVLAGTVAGGIARTQEERHRNKLAEHFSPAVAEHVATDPNLMMGRDAEVSVLFCDIRGFSSVTEKLGAQKTIEWINDVLSELTQCVVDHDGVLVDYVGDELLAMWGAPVDQPDHARRAVDAAIAMLDAIEVLRERWADILPQRFGAGIGVNTGAARVGNVGSRQMTKYGVLGNTVNLGSRLQAATKQLGVDCLVSSASIEAAGIKDARRIAKLAVVGIDEPIDVFQILHAPKSSWPEFRADYEAALQDYENKRFGEATRRLGELMQTHPGDRPCKLLLSRAVDRLDEPLDGFSPVWKLTSK